MKASKASATLLFTTASLQYISCFITQSTSLGRGTNLFMSSALIVQNKGGGHGELGYQIAKNLEANSIISSITILQDEACKDEEEPFRSYSSDLPDVRVVKAPLGDDSMIKETLQSILGERDSYDYVWDNASKKPEGAGKALCDCAKDWGVKLYTYVSSAGMYQPTEATEFPMSETTPIKESAGQNLFDQYAIELGLPLVSFRPQYIYGKKANKFDYIDWYFDRLVRELPIPIPGDGTQLVSLSNSEDVASLLTAVLGAPEAAIEQRFFNCGTDQLHSYDDVARMCAEAAGISDDKIYIEHYDDFVFGKADFPFRTSNFYVSPDTAKEKLSWPGAKNTLKEDLKWYYEGYVARGGPTKKMSLVKDYEIMVASQSSFQLGSVYDKFDPVVIDTSEFEPMETPASENK